MINFSKNLQELLDLKGVSQKELTDYCGKSPAWLSVMKKRSTIPDAETLDKIISFLGISNRGLLLKDENEVIEDSQPKFKLPLLSYVQAGQYTETFCDENDVEYIEVPYSNIKEGCFCLQVKGDSMSRSPGKSYYDGIFVIVDPNCDKSKDALNRKVVIARTEEGATIKEFVLEGDKPYLRPWNDRFQILEVTAETVIIGIVIQSFD